MPALRPSSKGVRRLLVALVCLGSAISAAGAEEKRLVRIATEGASPPFNFIENNEPAGFEVELGKAICEAANFRCVFVIHDWNGILKALLTKEYDAIMASLAINERRKARIAFSKRYYRIPAAFIGRKDTEITSIAPEALAGKIVGATENSWYATYLEERYKETALKTYGKVEEATLDLLTERIDLVLGDKLALSRFLEGREGTVCCRFVGDVPADVPAFGEGVAVGLRKEDADLKEAFDRAIDRVMADGTYDRIRAKYFSFDIK